MPDERKIIVLGTIQLSDDGERLVLPAINLDASPEAITAALEAAEIDRLRREAEETRALAEMFHLPKGTRS